MEAVKESWEKTIEVMSLLVGNSYTIKNLFIKDYGRATNRYGKRTWTSDYGKVVLLGRIEDISFLPDYDEYDIGKLINLLEVLNNNKHSFVIGNNFFYPSGIEIPIDSRLCIPSELNNIIYYGDRNDSLGVIAKEVYNSVLTNNLEVDIEDIKYRRKKKLKKIWSV